MNVILTKDMLVEHMIKHNLMQFMELNVYASTVMINQKENAHGQAPLHM